jgi:ABC-type glycerol-3-phosphate transport system substrate-binding protein
MGGQSMKALLPGFLLAGSVALSVASASADDVSANLRLMAFGGDAQLTAVKHAVERFNQKYPNVEVEVHASNVHVFDAHGTALARDVHPRMEARRVETLP